MRVGIVGPAEQIKQAGLLAKVVRLGHVVVRDHDALPTCDVVVLIAPAVDMSKYGLWLQGIDFGLIAATAPKVIYWWEPGETEYSYTLERLGNVQVVDTIEDVLAELGVNYEAPQSERDAAFISAVAGEHHGKNNNN